MAKKCAFCTRAADSREHIFSDWMLNMLPPNERYALTERIARSGEYVNYKGRRIKLRAKVVCTRCNNNWMSVLEEKHLKPAMEDLLFKDDPALLAPQEIVPIAAFAFKTLVIANHKDLTTTPFFSSAQHTEFRLRLRIPGGVQVWMASREMIAGKYRGFWKSSYGKLEEKSPYGFSNYVCTWGFQNIVLQILATKWINKKRRNTLPTIPFIQENYWDDASIPIWPSNGRSIQWPPPCCLGDDTIDAFRDRFDMIRVTLPSA
jgi:hypothetical protein